MAVKTWIGSTSTSFTTAGNWSPSGIPADGDLLLFNDQATQAMDTDCDSASVGAKAFDVIVDRAYPYHCGSSSVKFGSTGDATNNKVFKTLYFAGSGLTPSYFDTGTGDTSTRVIVDTQSTKDDVINLSGNGSWGDLVVRNGRAKLDLTTITGRMQVFSGASTAQAILNVGAGNTLSSAELFISGGKVTCSSSPSKVTVMGGEFWLEGSAGVTTRLEMHGGVSYWMATTSSTIALAEIFGGTFKTTLDRSGRTLTNMNVYGTGVVDFSIGGFNITFTNPPRKLGVNDILMPPGSTVTFGI